MNAWRIFWEGKMHISDHSELLTLIGLPLGWGISGRPQMLQVLPDLKHWSLCITVSSSVFLRATVPHLSGTGCRHCFLFLFYDVLCLWQKIDFESFWQQWRLLDHHTCQYLKLGVGTGMLLNRFHRSVLWQFYWARRTAAMLSGIRSISAIGVLARF